MASRDCGWLRGMLMTDILNLAEARDKRDGPDAEHIDRDGYGRRLYRYTCSYRIGRSEYTLYLWAYDFEDAERHADAVRAGLVVDGQVYIEGAS